MSFRMSATFLALVLGISLGACGDDDDSGSSGDGDGALTVYSGREEKLIAPLLEDLGKAAGRKVEVRYGDSAELAAQILEEGERPKADLFLSQDAGALGALTKAGRLTALPQAALGKVNAKYRAKDGTWVGLSGRARVIVYDPKQVTEVPKSVSEVTDSKWKGKVGYPPTNASFQAFVTAMRVTAGEDKAEQWLKDLKKNDAKTYEKNTPVLDAVDDGKIALGLINHYYWYQKVAELGEDKVKAKIAFLPGGDPGALVNVAGVGVLKGKQNDATNKAVDFLLGARAQTYFADKTKEFPLASRVKTTVKGLPPLESLEGPEIDLSDLASLEETLTLLKKVGLT